MTVSLGGRFWLPSFGPEAFLPNRFQKEGMQLFLEILFQGDDVSIPLAGGEFFVGLCGNAAVGVDATLVSITDEVPEVNNYARIPLERNITDWPLIEEIGDQMRVVSKEMTWTATGGDFQSSFTRIFLTDVLTGTAGNLISLSQPMTVPFTVVEDADFPARYELYFKG
jgi:hypothetical protein